MHVIDFKSLYVLLDWCRNGESGFSVIHRCIHLPTHLLSDMNACIDRILPVIVGTGRQALDEMSGLSGFGLQEECMWLYHMEGGHPLSTQTNPHRAMNTDMYVPYPHHVTDTDTYVPYPHHVTDTDMYVPYPHHVTDTDMYVPYPHHVTDTDMYVPYPHHVTDTDM